VCCQTEIAGVVHRHRGRHGACVERPHTQGKHGEYEPFICFHLGPGLSQVVFDVVSQL